MFLWKQSSQGSPGFSLSYGIWEFLGLSALSFEGPRANIKSPILCVAYFCIIFASDYLKLKVKAFILFLIIMTENDNTTSEFQNQVSVRNTIY